MMPGILATFAIAATAFVATNIDDILVLMVFFAQVDTSFRRRHVVLGQYIGMGALVTISLLGFMAGVLVPEEWIGLLGLVPIALGVHALVSSDDETGSQSPGSPPAPPSAAGSRLHRGTFTVAAVIIANGGDNIGVYAPLFSTLDRFGLAVTLGVFAALVAVLCFVADRLARQPLIAAVLSRSGRHLVPIVLIGLGLFILVDSGLVALALSAVS